MIVYRIMMCVTVHTNRKPPWLLVLRYNILVLYIHTLADRKPPLLSALSCIYICGWRIKASTLITHDLNRYRPEMLCDVYITEWCIVQLYQYTGSPRRNVPVFGRVFLMLKYTDITQNTYIQSWTVTEIMARQVWNFDRCYTLIDYQIHIITGRNILFL